MTGQKGRRTVVLLRLALSYAALGRRSRTSLAYFLPVIEEVLAMRIGPEYFQHVRRKLERIARDR